MKAWSAQLAVKQASTQGVDWLNEWRPLAHLVEGISTTSPIYGTVVALLDALDVAFKGNHVEQFFTLKDELTRTVTAPEPPVVQSGLF